jgi:hypothetical protein
MRHVKLISEVKSDKELRRIIEGGFEVLTAVIMTNPIFLRYDAVYFVQMQPTYERSMSPPSSGSKNKPSKKPL